MKLDGTAPVWAVRFICVISFFPILGLPFTIGPAVIFVIVTHVGYVFCLRVSLTSSFCLIQLLVWYCFISSFSWEEGRRGFLSGSTSLLDVVSTVVLVCEIGRYYARV